MRWRTVLYGVLWGQVLGADPLAVYLTFHGDPTTSISVQWHQQQGEETLPVMYRPVGLGNWILAKSTVRPWEPAHRDVYCARLSGLIPGQRYEFHFGEEETRYTFHTLQDPTKGTLRFAVGGDMRCEWRPSRFRSMAKAVAAENPDFVIAGGDLAYCRGRPGAWGRWDLWLREWQELMVNARGDLIPVMPVLGNHEVDGGYDQNPSAAPHFFALFDLPEESSVRCMDIGKEISILLLDSGHCHKVEGDQTLWIQRALAQRRKQVFRCAVYHVPAYACRDSASEKSAAVRTCWAPVFEKEGVEVAFEHHHHALKRSKPIKYGKATARGTVYLGDGAWGVPPRAIERDEYRALMDYVAAVNGCWIADCVGKKMVVRAIDRNGKELDRLVVLARPHQ